MLMSLDRLCARESLCLVRRIEMPCSDFVSSRVQLALIALLTLVVCSSSAVSDEISLFVVAGQSNARPEYAIGIESGLRASGRWENVVVYNQHKSGSWFSGWVNGIQTGNYSPAGFYNEGFWASDGSSELQQRIAQLELEGHTVTVEGFFWFQGEGDTGGTARHIAGYSDALIWMIDSLRGRYGKFDVVITLVDWNHDRPGELGAIGRTPEKVDQIRAQLAIAADDLDGLTADSRGWVRTDLWHISDSNDPRGLYAAATDFGADQAGLMIQMSTCEGDLTGDGVLDFFDISAFLRLMIQGCP